MLSLANIAQLIRRWILAEYQGNFYHPSAPHACGSVENLI